MADILLVGVREEGKADFIIELVKELMSRGLVISYAGAYYCESKDCFVYDDITNLLFFSSTYFREAPMKSKRFETWEGFLGDINFKRTDVRAVVYVNTCMQEAELSTYFGNLKDDFSKFLKDSLKDQIVELLRNSFEMGFFQFESCYPEFVEILGVDRRKIIGIRKNADEQRSMIEKEWDSKVFESFIRNCMDIREEIMEEGIQEIEIEMKKKKSTIKDVFEEFRDLRKEYKGLKEKETLSKEEKSRREKIEKEIAQLESNEEYAPLESKIFEKGKPKIGTLRKLKETQENLEIECLMDTSKANELVDRCLGSIFDRAEENHERAMYFDVLNRAPEKKILCICYEGNGKGINLYFYPEKPTEEGNEEPPRSRMGEFDPPRDVYAHENIERIVDEHIMLALHPSLVNIRFPDNDFMLEVDPEEPEIGFLSRRITMNKFEKIKEHLDIDTSLGDMLHLYRLDEDEKEGPGKRFHKVEPDYRTKKQKEDILILGRVEHLYELLIKNRIWRCIYREVFSILRWLVVLLPPAAIVLYLCSRLVSPHYSIFLSDVLPTIGVLLGILLGTAFAFWTLRTFALNYLLEPFYNMAKRFTYIFFAVIILVKVEFFKAEFLAIFVAIFLFVGISFARYIRSAIFYEINKSFDIIEYNDTLEIRNRNSQNNPKTVNILKVGRFQTTVAKKGDDEANNTAEVLFNSDFFPAIRCIHKKIRTLPREMAYSSGIYLSQENKKKKSNSVEELIYRKPKAWGSWRILKNFLLDKGQIESRKKPDDEYSPSERLIYFGQWDSVMKNVGGSIPLFSQSVLFRSMIIIAIVAVLLFSFLFSGKVPEIGFLEVALFLVISSSLVLIAWKLRVQFPKVLLALVLFLLLLVQPHEMMIMLVVPIFFFLMIAVWLLIFPIKQMLFYLVIWIFEKCTGHIISAIDIYEDHEKKENEKSFLVMRGTEIKKNLLLTKLSMRLPTGLEEERTYFNEMFFYNIILSRSWYLRTDSGNGSTICKTLFLFALDFVERNYSRMRRWLQIYR